MYTGTCWHIQVNIKLVLNLRICLADDGVYTKLDSQKVAFLQDLGDHGPAHLPILNSNVCLVTNPSIPFTQDRWVGKSLFLSVPLGFSMFTECHILQAFFTFYDQVMVTK